MKYCKYCGKKIKEGQVCNCSKNKKNNPELFTKTKSKKTFNIKKVLIPVTSIIVLAILSVGGYHLFNKYNKEIEVSKRLVVLEKGEYYLTNVKNNISFEIKMKDEDVSSKIDNDNIDYSYSIVDEDGKEVETELKTKDLHYVIKPKNKYEEGKKYTLTLNNYEFLDEEMKNSNVVIFKIEKEEIVNIKVNEKVKPIEKKAITVENDKVIKSSNDYNEGEILYIENEAAYKITKKNEDGTYDYVVPTVEETFDELDIYHDGKVEYDDFEVSEEMYDYYTSALMEQEWYEAILMKVNAKKEDGKVNKITFRTDSLGRRIIGFSIVISPSNYNNDKYTNQFKFSLLKNHVFTLSLEFTIDLDSHVDFSRVIYREMDVYITIDTEFKLGISPLGAEIDHFIKKDFSTWTDDEINKYRNTMSSDKQEDEDIKKHLGGVSGRIATGLYFDIDFYTLLELNMSLNADLTLTNSMKANAGYIKKPFELHKPHGYLHIDTPEIKGSVLGKAETRVGLETVFGLKFINLVGVDLSVKSGFYADASVGIGGKLKDGKLTNQLYFNSEAGLFSQADINVLDESILSINVYDERLKLYENNSDKEDINRIDITDVEAKEYMNNLPSSKLSSTGMTAQEYADKQNLNFVCGILNRLSTKGLITKNVSFDTIDKEAKLAFGNVTYTIPKNGWCQSEYSTWNGEGELPWKYNSSTKTLTYVENSDWGVGGPGCFVKKFKSYEKYFESAYKEKDYLYINYRVLGTIDNYKASDFYGPDCYDKYKSTEVYKNANYKTKIATVYKTSDVKKYRSKGDVLTYVFKKGENDNYIFDKTVLLEREDL